MQTAYDLVRLAAERTPDRIAIVDDRHPRHLTYRELVVEIDSIAAGFLLAGIKPGRPVLTALPNLFEHCLAVLALQRLGVVVALANARLPPAQIAGLADIVDAQGAIILDSDPMHDALDEHLLVWRVGEGGTANFAQCQGVSALLPERPRPAAETPAFILFTSGTTGQPKPVLLPHRATGPRMNWMTQLAGVRPDPDLRTLGAAPIFHAIGLYGCFLFTLSMGGTYHTLSAFDPALAMQQVATHRLTMVFLVPTMFQAIAAHPGYRAAHFASVRHALYGGGPIDARLLRRLAAEWPAEWTNAYGTTEIMVPLYCDRPLGAPRELRVAVGWRARVVRIGGTADEIVAVGDIGELIFDAENDNLFLGYLDNAAATQEKVRDGWYRSGDLARRGVDSVEIVGRSDDMIRSGSETIYPEEIETVLQQHDDVADVCVVGLADDFWGERVVALVVAANPLLNDVTLDDWLRQVARLADYKKPKTYRFVERIPKTMMNKVDRTFARLLAAAPDSVAEGRAA